MKLRRLRDGDVLEDGDVVLVRGGDLDPDILSEDAVRYHSIYGVYGISVFAVRDATIDELAQQAPLVRFDRLSLLTVSDVLAAGRGWSRPAATRVITPWASMTSLTACSGWSGARIRSCRTPTTTRNLVSGGTLMDARIDLAADLNDEDDEGLGWSTLSEASDPARIRPGVMVVAGNRQAQAVVRVVAVDDDGQVHFAVLPGSVAKNSHLIGRALA
jgi:hypothetical protein